MTWDIPDNDFAVCVDDIEESPPPEIAAAYPPVLLKALYDTQWRYVLETTIGRQFVFESATAVSPDWVHLEGDFSSDDKASDLYFGIRLNPNACLVRGRGVNVRIDQIVWLIDGDS